MIKSYLLMIKIINNLLKLYLIKFIRVNIKLLKVVINLKKKYL